MDLRVIRGPEVLRLLGESLDELHRETHAPIMARRPWIETWVRCYTDHEPWAVTVWRNGRLDASALLATRERRGIAEVVRMGHGATDHARLPARDTSAAEMLGAGVADALAARRGPWLLSLGQIPAADPVLRALARTLQTCAVGPGDGSPTLRFGEGPLERHLSRNYRKNLRYARGRIRKSGVTAEFAHLRDADDIAAVLAEADPVRRKRDAQKRRADKLADSRYATFRRTVVGVLARRDEAELTTLRVGGALAAYGLALLDGPSYRWWDGRVAPEWAHLYAGRLLMHEIISRSFELGFAEFDLMRGSLDYKLWIANEVVPSETLAAWSSPLLRVAVSSTERIVAATRAVRSALRT